MNHPQLAKEMGFNKEDRSLTFITASGKELISQLIEKFQI